MAQLHCSFRSFSNRGRVNSACRHEMAQRHAQHGQKGKLGANPGRYLNAAAPLIVKSTRPRRLAGHERHAVPVGPQLEEKAVRVVASLLRTGVWQGESGNWIRNWRSSSSSFFCGSRTISATRTPPGGRERGPRTACWPWKRSPGNGGLPGNEFPF